MKSDQELRELAEKRAEEKSGFYIHLTVYVMVNLTVDVIYAFLNPTIRY